MSRYLRIDYVRATSARDARRIEEKIRLALKRVLSTLSHDSHRRYSLAIMRIVQVAGAATVLSMGLMIFIWTRHERRQVG